MNYRISDEISIKAKSVIENDELAESISALNQKLKNLKVSETSALKKTVFTEGESNILKGDLAKLNSDLDVLNFQKTTEEINLNHALENLDIKQAVEIKNKISNLDAEISKNDALRNIQNCKIAESNNLYESELVNLREMFKECDFDAEKASGFSESAINDFKKEKSSQIVNNFLNDFPEEKQKQILDNHPELKGYINVGENI